ncbi:MAG: hypothetical protein LBD37_03760 [Treponema sp.]|jgi:hypothetical protein|nr:hypothetical protein [Treponema sp.]
MRWSSIAGGGAFVLSFLIGLISGAGVFALVRALVFGAVFFGLAAGVYWLINQFFPEFLAGASPGGSGGEGAAGSQVDITVEGDDDFAAAGLFRPPAAGRAEPDGLDGPPEPAGGGALDTALDQTDEEGYTAPEPQGAAGGAARGAAIPSEGDDAVDTLPDLEGISGGYQPMIVEDTMDISTEPPNPARKPSMNSAKPLELDGDFRPKEIAAAIQTLLKRE